MKTKNVSRGHPDLNQGPVDLQSNALPLSYAPSCIIPNHLGYINEIRHDSLLHSCVISAIMNI